MWFCEWLKARFLLLSDIWNGIAEMYSYSFGEEWNAIAEEEPVVSVDAVNLSI